MRSVVVSRADATLSMLPRRPMPLQALQHLYSSLYAFGRSAFCGPPPKQGGTQGKIEFRRGEAQTPTSGKERTTARPPSHTPYTGKATARKALGKHGISNTILAWRRTTRRDILTRGGVLWGPQRGGTTKKAFCHGATRACALWFFSLTLSEPEGGGWECCCAALREKELPFGPPSQWCSSRCAHDSPSPRRVQGKTARRRASSKEVTHIHTHTQTDRGCKQDIRVLCRQGGCMSRVILF